MPPLLLALVWLAVACITGAQALLARGHTIRLLLATLVVLGIAQFGRHLFAALRDPERGT